MYIPLFDARMFVVYMFVLVLFLSFCFGFIVLFPGFCCCPCFFLIFLYFFLESRKRIKEFCVKVHKYCSTLKYMY